MKRSPLRTALAKLREEVRLTQEQMGKLIGLKRPTVQAIELGHSNLRLTEERAAKASAETGISARWLLENDPEKPMVAAPEWGGGLYDRSLFEHIQATAQAMARDPDRQRYLRHRKSDAWSIELCSEWFGILAAARKNGKQEVAEYLLGQFMDDMKERFGYDPKGKRHID